MKKYKVTFKESYMPHEVTREAICENKEQVIKFYGLDNSDIEWYKIEEISE